MNIFMNLIRGLFQHEAIFLLFIVNLQEAVRAHSRKMSYGTYYQVVDLPKVNICNL